jgi:hypothetical protein
LDPRDMGLFRPLPLLPTASLPLQIQHRLRPWTSAAGRRRVGEVAEMTVSGYPPFCPLRLPPLPRALESVKVGGGGASSTTRRGVVATLSPS